MEHSLETITYCPVCKSEEQESFLDCIDLTYSHDSFSIVKCKNCEFKFTNPRPDAASVGKYYDNPEYVSHTDTSKGLLFSIYRIIKSYALKQKRGYCTKISTDRIILDYGAGTGDFANEMHRNGWSVTVFEPDLAAARRIQTKYPEIDQACSLSDIKDNSIPLVTLWHVLEHVHELKETLGEFSRISTENGKLLIAVPNYTSFDARYYKDKWAAYDVPRHLYHFDPNTISALMKQHGFILTSVRPMLFDAFYVSLLSEGVNESHILFKKVFLWIRALTIGLLSSLNTLLNKNHCSSLIYVFEKHH